MARAKPVSDWVMDIGYRPIDAIDGERAGDSPNGNYLAIPATLGAAFVARHPAPLGPGVDSGLRFAA